MNEVIIGLGLTQVLLPIVLIVANTFAPSATRLGLGLRSAAVFVLLLYAALAGLWLFPPWWTPYLFMGLFAIGAVYRLRRIRPSQRSWTRRLEQAVATLALIGAVALVLPVYQGRSVPDGAVDLAMPLGPGRYLVMNGGTTETINAHLFTLTAERARAFRGQRYPSTLSGSISSDCVLTGSRPSIRRFT